MAAIASDAQIQQDVLDALRYDIRVDATQISVEVTSGVVRLSGSVPTSFQKGTAGHDVQRIKGVRTVVNALVVAPAGTWADDETAQIVRDHLERDVRIANPSQIHVVVVNGIVTLSGGVMSPGERTDAADDARTDPGVVHVVNHLTVIPTTMRSDVAISADVRRELDADPSIDASNIDVNVVKGTVFLRGTIPTSYEAHGAVHDAWRVRGVRDVVDALNIPL